MFFVVISNVLFIALIFIVVNLLYTFFINWILSIPQYAWNGQHIPAKPSKRFAELFHTKSAITNNIS